MTIAKADAIAKIEKQCEAAGDGECVDILLTDFHAAYGPPDPKQARDILNLRRRFGFKMHEYNSDRTVLRLIEPVPNKGAEQ